MRPWGRKFDEASRPALRMWLVGLASQVAGAKADVSSAPAPDGQTEVATLLKVVDRLLPSSDTAAMMTTAIRATIRPYSTAVAPRSETRRLWILAASLVMILFLRDAALGPKV